MARKSPSFAVPLLTAAVLASIALTACTTFDRSAEPSSAPVPRSTTGTALPPPDSGPAATSTVSPYGDANSGGTYPYGAVPGEGETAATEPNVVVTDPQGNILSEQSPDAKYQETVDACYRFALARIARDVRMESDAAASLDQYSEGLGLTDLRGRMQDFEQSGRRRELFERCMRERGYTPK